MLGILQSIPTARLRFVICQLQQPRLTRNWTLTHGPRFIQQQIQVEYTFAASKDLGWAGWPAIGSTCKAWQIMTLKPKLSSRSFAQKRKRNTHFALYRQAFDHVCTQIGRYVYRDPDSNPYRTATCCRCFRPHVGTNAQVCCSCDSTEEQGALASEKNHTCERARAAEDVKLSDVTFPYLSVLPNLTLAMQDTAQLRPHRALCSRCSPRLTLTPWPNRLTQCHL